jgi:hypothetical protein
MLARSPQSSSAVCLLTAHSRERPALLLPTAAAPR